MDVWQALTQEEILNGVENVLKRRLSGLLIPRNSYINRVYEVSVSGSEERFIVKFYRPGRWAKDIILEEHSLLQKLSEKELNVILPVSILGKTLFELGSIYFAVFPKRGGRALDEFDKEGWLEIGRTIGRVHLVSSAVREPLRIKWKPEIATQNNLKYLLEGGFLPAGYSSSLERLIKVFLSAALRRFDKTEQFLIHGDCHKGNLIHRPGEGIYLIDFDDICVGPPVQDIWMLLPGSLEECFQELEWFLEGYEIFRKFDRNSLELIPFLKIMRIMHYASWCAMQSKDATFREHFLDWGSIRYWNELIRDIQQIMDDIS